MSSPVEMKRFSKHGSLAKADTCRRLSIELQTRSVIETRLDAEADSYTVRVACVDDDIRCFK